MHYTQVNPDIKKDKWTAAEDSKLIKLVEAHGGAWAEIARQYVCWWMVASVVVPNTYITYTTQHAWAHGSAVHGPLEAPLGSWHLKGPMDP